MSNVVRNYKPNLSARTGLSTAMMLSLGNGRVVPAVQIHPYSLPSGLARQLEITYTRGAVAVVGGAAAFDEPAYTTIRQKTTLLLEELAQLAITYKLAIVDGGTPFGAMKLLGETCRQHRYRFPLIGVAPSGKVAWNTDQGINYQQTWYGQKFDLKKYLDERANLTPLDEHHTAFVLVEANEWGDEVEMLAATAHELASGQQSLEVLINGGAVARRDVLAYLQQGGNVIVVEGTGRFADELARAIRAGFSVDPAIQSVLNTRRVHLFSIHQPPQMFACLLMNLGRWTA